MKNTLADFINNKERNTCLPILYSLVTKEKKAKNYFVRFGHNIYIEKYKAGGEAVRFYKPISKFR